MQKYNLYINGANVEPDTAGWFDTSEPYSGKVWAQIARGTKADADQAIEAAHSAFTSKTWRQMTATRRGAIMRTSQCLCTQSQKLG